MSDRGIPASYRHMHASKPHHFSFINAKKSVLVQVPPSHPSGIKNLTDEERKGRREVRESTSGSVQSIEKGELPPLDHVRPCQARGGRREGGLHPFDLTK